MIHAISGKPGGGKSLFGMKALVNELRTTHRYVVTNLAVRIPELCDYLHRNYGQTFCALQRITVLDDEQVRKFWLHRGNGLILLDDEQNDFSSADASNYFWLPTFEGKIFNGSGMGIIRDGIPMFRYGGEGVAYFLDELHLFFNAREWAKTGKACIFFLSQHRKCNNDVIWITQHIENVDKQFRSLTQDFTYVRNFSKEKFASHFRSLPWFGYKVFQSPVTATSVGMVPSEQGRFLLDAKGLAACYDTAKGVGFAGNVAADTQQKKKGLPFWMIIPGSLLLLVGVWALVNYGLVGLMAYVHGSAKKVTSKPIATPAHLPVSNSNNALVSPWPSNSETNAPEKRRSSKSPPDDVAMLGYACIDGIWRVALSDGRIVQSTDPEFETLTSQGLKYAGQYYRRALVSYKNGVNEAFGAPVQPAPLKPINQPERAAPPELPDINHWTGRPVTVHWADGKETHHTITEPPSQ